MSCCTDIDECDQLLDDCSAEEKCMNTDGGFSCTCLEGYQRVGYRKCAGKTNVQFSTKSCGMSELSRFAYSLTASDRKYYWLTPFYSRVNRPQNYILATRLISMPLALDLGTLNFTGCFIRTGSYT